MSNPQPIALAKSSRLFTNIGMISQPSALTLGQKLARGTCRHLQSHGFACLEELVPAPGLRVDVMALGPKGEIWVIECKSSRTDYLTDQKWHNYLQWCDRFFWAVHTDFPTELLPYGTGLLFAEIIRMPPEAKLAGGRRKSVTQIFARTAAHRLQALRDPGPNQTLRIQPRKAAQKRAHIIYSTNILAEGIRLKPQIRLSPSALNASSYHHHRS